MPIVNRVADLQPDIQAWRRDIHEHPELLYEVHRTAAFVADRLREFGCDEVATGLGKTGVVGVIKGKKQPGKGDAKVIGLRADMDALPIEEATNLPYASKNKGLMHACGHDGHTAMLLGAARYLAETRNFAGDAVVIFQPAEEGGAGAAAMIKDGLMDRFGIEQVYGMHNGPGIPVGSFAIRTGPIMASTASIDVKIEGLGGHAARPHKCIDSLLVGAHTHDYLPLLDPYISHSDGKKGANIEFWNKEPCSGWLDHWVEGNPAVWSTPTLTSNCFLMDGIVCFASRPHVV